MRLASFDFLFSLDSLFAQALDVPLGNEVNLLFDACIGGDNSPVDACFDLLYFSKPSRLHYFQIGLVHVCHTLHLRLVEIGVVIQQGITQCWKCHLMEDHFPGRIVDDIVLL